MADYVRLETDYKEAHPEMLCKKELLESLYNAQKEASGIPIPGRSSCRICGSKSGARQFQLRSWQWGQDLAHYIEEHNVPPEAAFVEFLSSFGP